MALTSRDLSPVPIPDRADVDTFLAQSGRIYQPRSEPDLSHPSTFGAPGGESNRDFVGNSLNAWWVYGDRKALDSALATAFATASWLIDAHNEWDHAHCHRNKWFGACALAAREVGLQDSTAQKFISGFNSWLSWLSNDKYVNGNFSGLTLRPTRVLYEAIIVSWMAKKLEKSLDLIPLFDPEVTINRAFACLTEWSRRRWDPKKKQTWGWTMAPGTWTPIEGINKFPFLDGRDPIAMAKQTTWFHAGHVTLGGLMNVREVLPYSWKMTEELPARARDLAQHAALFGYDPITGLSLKSIGFKDGKNTKGCYAPGFQDAPFSEWPLKERETKGEHEYDLIPMLLACPGTVQNRIESCQNLLARGSKALSPGEISIGILKATNVAKKAGLLG